MVRLEIAPRITMDPEVMGGKPRIRGLRVTVGTILGLLSGHRTREEILRAYPYLEPEDIEARTDIARTRTIRRGDGRRD